MTFKTFQVEHSRLLDLWLGQDRADWSQADIDRHSLETGSKLTRLESAHPKHTRRAAEERWRAVVDESHGDPLSSGENWEAFLDSQVRPVYLKEASCRLQLSRLQRRITSEV